MSKPLLRRLKPAVRFAAQSHRDGHGPLRHYRTVRDLFYLGRLEALHATYCAYWKNWDRENV